MKYHWFIYAILLHLIMKTAAFAAPDMFARTDPGHIEIKEIPAGTLLKSQVEGSYFDHSNRLFRPLFRYISNHEIAMTRPVEARIEPGAMFFWVAPSEVHKAEGDRGGVQVVEKPARTVLAAGGRGSYSERNFRAAEKRLREWLAEQTEWQATGEAYGVYWHGPFTPWFRKQYEVHLPVSRAPESS